MGKQYSLRTLLFLAVAVALVPIAVLSVSQSLSNRDFSNQLIEHRLVSAALATGAAQREPIDMARQMVERFAGNNDILYATPNCAAAFRRGLAIRTAITNFARSGADGYVQCSALPYSQPVSSLDQPWWHEGIKRRKFTLSTPIMGKISKKQIIIAMLPLFNSNGTFEGAITAGISTRWMDDALKERSLSPNAIVAVTDRTGKILMSEGPGALPQIDVGNSQGKASEITSNNGGEWLYASSPLFEDQLYVVYAEPRRGLVAPVQNQLAFSIFLPLLALFLTALALWIAMNLFVIRWLKQLAQMTRRLERGEKVPQLANFDGAPTEIGQLGQDFLHMADAVEQRTAELRLSSDKNHAMAKEVNHRVKNNLQMIISMIGLQSSRLKDVEAKNALEQTRMRMSAIALIHRVAYEMDNASDHGEVDMARLIAALCGQLRRGPPNHLIDLKCQSNVGQMSVDHALPISLFAVEAVANSYQHGFTATAEGSIEIALSGSSLSGTLTITDNGSGYDPDVNERAMGSDLMDAYAAQVGGHFEVAKVEPTGVVITLYYDIRSMTM